MQRANDTSRELIDLTPYDFFPWATEVPGRGWLDDERFKRHRTLGHARSSIANSSGYSNGRKVPPEGAKIYHWDSLDGWVEFNG